MVRRTFLSLLAAAAAGLLLMAAPLGRVSACSCEQLSPAEALASAHSAFIGVVGRVEPPVAGGKGVEDAGVAYVIQVEDALKGGWQAGDAARVQVELGTCGMSFAIGQRWRLHTSLQGVRHVTSICSGNELLAEGVPLPEPAPGTDGGIPAELAFGLGIVAVVAGVSVWGFTRRGTAAPGAGRQ